MTSVPAGAYREESTALKAGVWLGLIYLATAIFVVGALLSGKALLEEHGR